MKSSSSTRSSRDLAVSASGSKSSDDDGVITESTRCVAMIANKRVGEGSEGFFLFP